MSSWIRKEAVESQRQRLLGEVVLAQPLSFTVLALFMVSIVATVMVFVTTGSYARKETVTGHLSPEKGLVKIHAPRPGIVGQLYVHEGQVVCMSACSFDPVSAPIHALSD